MKHGSYPSQLFTTLMSLAFALPPSIIGCTFDYEKCEPQCHGRQCGPNGCGGSCGECGGSEVCTPEGACCEPDCAYKQCGDDGCGGQCGSCPAGQVCDQLYRCCEPDCEGKECGSDGCGWLCGACGDRACEEGSCVSLEKRYPGPCERLTDLFITGEYEGKTYYEYNEFGEIAIEENDTNNDGIIDSLFIHEYNEFGKLVRYEQYYENLEIPEYTEDYTYDVHNRLESLMYYSFDEDLPRSGVVFFYYDANGLMTKAETDENIDGSIDRRNVFVYDEVGRVIDKSVDFEPDGIANIRWNYKYEVGTSGVQYIIEDYYEPAEGPLSSSRTEVYNNKNLLIMEWVDVGGDGNIERVSSYAYNSLDEIVYRCKDNENDGINDTCVFSFRDSFGNISIQLFYTTEGTVHLYCHKYSCAH